MVFPLSFDSFVNLELNAKKKLTDSEPTRPEEPVIIATDIKNIYLI